MRKTLFLALLVLFPIGILAEDTEDFGGWLGLSTEKGLGKHWEMGVGAELRLEDNFRKVDRWSVGANIGYKPVKFLKLNAAYDFLYGYTSSKTSKEEYDLDGELMAYRFTPSYWTPRHRVSLDVTATTKVRWMRVSLRERYQYTRQAEQTITGRYDTEMPDWEHDPVKDKVVDGADTHILRSRFKLQVDKKKLDWSPFISVEAQNLLNEKMHLYKVRTCVGTEYKVNRHNDLSFALVLTNHLQEHKTKMAVSVGYSHDF